MGARARERQSTTAATVVVVAATTAKRIQFNQTLSFHFKLREIVQANPSHHISPMYVMGNVNASQSILSH